MDGWMDGLLKASFSPWCSCMVRTVGLIRAWSRPALLVHCSEITLSRYGAIQVKLNWCWFERMDGWLEYSRFGRSSRPVRLSMPFHGTKPLKTTTKTFAIIVIYVMGIRICSLIIHPCSRRTSWKKNKQCIELFASTSWCINPSLSEPWKRTACTLRKPVTYSRVFI